MRSWVTAKTTVRWRLFRRSFRQSGRPHCRWSQVDRL